MSQFQKLKAWECTAWGMFIILNIKWPSKNNKKSFYAGECFTITDNNKGNQRANVYGGVEGGKGTGGGGGDVKSINEAIKQQHSLSEVINASEHSWVSPKKRQIQSTNAMRIPFSSKTKMEACLRKSTHGDTWLLTRIKYILQNFLSFITRGHNSYLNFEISCKWKLIFLIRWHNKATSLILIQAKCQCMEDYNVQFLWKLKLFES